MRSDPAVYIRLPSDLREQLVARAKENSRSVTGEVAHLLKQHLRPDPKQAQPATVLEPKA